VFNIKGVSLRPFLITNLMKVVTQEIPVIKCSPRFYPLLADVLVFTLDNGTIIPFNWTIEKNNIVATLESTAGFTQGSNYSFTITKGTDIVYKGKLMFLKDGTDVQNYTDKSQDTKRWE
jgi:hypothetical protein